MKIKDNKIKKDDLNKIRELLINIDMVNGFIKYGKLADISMMRVVYRQLELLKENEQSKYGLNVFVRDEHDIDSIEFKTFPPHCVKGTGEELVIDEFKELFNNAYDIPKNSTNFMFAPNTIDLLNNLPNLEKVKIMGCLSEICVKNGAISARCVFDQINKNVEVGVYEYAIDTYNAPGHNQDEITLSALKDMEANGVKIYRKER